jgi:DNA mismatch repair ATPase MutS
MKTFAAFAAALAFVGAVLILGVGSVIAQQNFSCPYGKQASCLDYGDKVCSSYSKCVDQNSICYSPYTCNYKGFMCASKYDELVDEYNDLLQKNKRLASEYNSLLRKDNELVDEYNSLLRKHNELIGKYNSLLDKHKEKVDEYDSLLNKYSGLESCISDADTLDEAQDCPQ